MIDMLDEKQAAREKEEEEKQQRRLIRELKAAEKMKKSKSNHLSENSFSYKSRNRFQYISTPSIYIYIVQ